MLVVVLITYRAVSEKQFFIARHFSRILYITMRTKQELKAIFVRGTWRLAAFEYGQGHDQQDMMV